MCKVNDINFYSSILNVSTFSSRARKRGIRELRMRSVIRQSVSYPCSTISGPSSLTTRITSFMKGYSNQKQMHSSTVFSTTSAAAMASITVKNSERES